VADEKVKDISVQNIVIEITAKIMVTFVTKFVSRGKVVVERILEGFIGNKK
jgi:hypothetical protein